MNNKGWIKILEASVAILLIAGVLLVVISQVNIEKKDISSQVYDVQVSILREIQLNDSLRNSVLDADPPIEWKEDNFPQALKEKINSRIPNYLECEAKICGLDESCELEEPPKKDVYAESTMVSTTLETPEGKQLKQLKLFCWEK